MTRTPQDEIEYALEILFLPKFVSRDDVKKQYHFLARKNHPDFGGDPKEMEKINHAYMLLTTYMDRFRYSFDEEEIAKQFPGADYVQRFKP